MSERRWVMAGVLWLGMGLAVAQDLPALNREMQACVVQVHLLAGSREPTPTDDLLRRFTMPSDARPTLRHPRGLGLLWRDGRHVLTLAHLLGRDKPALVAVQNEAGRRVAAESLGTDPLSGAWLLRLSEPLPNPPCRFGSARDLQLGQELLGIGNLLTLNRSLQRGIVAGLGREPDDSGQDLGEPLIQTDFRSAPGMAGGPLFDLQGRVVGLHDMMLPQGRQDLAALARPIDDLLRGAEALQAGQARQVSRIGLRMGEPSDAGAAENARDAAAVGRRWLAGPLPGVGVGEVAPGGPADRAGLRAGDRVLAVNDEPVGSEAALARRVARLPAGQPARFSVQRDGAPAVLLRVTPEPQQAAP